MPTETGRKTPNSGTETPRRGPGVFRRTRQVLDGRGKSFSVKVFRAFTVSVVIVMFFFTPFLIYYQSREVKKDLEKEGQMLAALLAYNVRTGVFAENRGMLEDPAKGILGQKNVMAVSIYTLDNKLLFNAEKRPLNRKPREGGSGIEGAGASQARSSRLPGVVDGDRSIEVISPVVFEPPADPEEALYLANADPAPKPKVIGYVKVTMDKSILCTEVRSILMGNGAIAIVLLLLGSVVIYFSVKRVTMPLTKLTEAVRLIGMGESVEKVEVTAADEIGRLADTFNTMAENLRLREEEKRQLEEKLRHAEKMEAVGTLARGIAHDFNNILSTVKGSLFLLEKKLQDDSPFRPYVRQIQSSLDKAKHLIEGLLTFSRLQKVNTRAVELNLLIRKLRGVLENMAGHPVRMRVVLDAMPLTITADPLQIEQVLMNLCSNARDSMPDGGHLTFETRPVTVGTDDTPLVKPGKYALISVSDSGTGMDETTKERIFEPFFTTKEVGRGTGLGLSIVYGIVEQHKGYIEVETQKGEGTTFRIYFPLTEEGGTDGENLEKGV